MALDMQSPSDDHVQARTVPALALLFGGNNLINSLPQAVLEAAEVSAVSQLVLRERFSRDFGLWEQMRDCFHDDSVVRISWITASGPEFVRRSKEMAERNVKASHRLGPILVTLSGDRAIAQVRAMIDIPFTLKGTEVIVSSHAHLLLRAERREGVWRLSGLDAVYLRDEIAPVMPGQTITVDPEEVRAFRPTYRLLSYCLASGGFPVRNDLAGIDRPDLLDVLIREIYGWAGLTPPR
jgi:SnoaL-like domain